WRENMAKVYVGVDLHKTQFTTFYRKEGQDGKHQIFVNDSKGYRDFKTHLGKITCADDEVRIAVESTGNTRYFKNTVEPWGCEVVVVNTLKFKVINESVKKTDKHDARTLAEFLEKDMLPEAHICSWKSEELRRLLKVRQTLVRTTVTVKNQIHGM